LESHVGEKGATWAKHPAYATDSAAIASNRLRCAAAAALYLANGEAPSPDVEASINIFGITTAASDIGAMIRLDPIMATGYGARFVPASGVIQIIMSIYGTLTSLGSYTVSPALVAGDLKKLTIKGAGSSIKALLDGVEIISVSDTSIKDGGFVGFRGGVSTGAAAGFHVDSFEAKIAA
jgi:hypothetical protein